MPIVISGTNGISGVDGTASSPALEGTDANTGVFFPAADTVAIATGGSERVRVDSNGNVGIGQTSPQFPLHITGASGVNSYAHFTNATTGNTSSDGFSIGVFTGASDAYIIQREPSPLFFFTNSLERARITSTGSFDLTQATTQGAYLRSQSFVTLASNATLTLTSTICGSVLVCVYQRGDGDGGVFFANYASATTLIAGQGSATDAGSTFAVYKSSSSHTLTLRNRYAASKTFAIAIYSADAQP